ncbi:MAG: hypothetical protein IPJ74_04310 [Saprospiraceae bacterium]|nr:hypothetical protein [Saprospiraceae bacterium]
MKPGFYIIAILLLNVLVACDSEEEAQRIERILIEQNVEKRLADYKMIHDRNCRTKILEEATRIADSLIILEARLSKDTLLKPFKPERPEKPALKTLPDTAKIKPFLPKPRRDTDTLSQKNG